MPFSDDQNHIQDKIEFESVNEMDKAQTNPLLGFIRDRLEEADSARRYKENQWLCNVAAVRGEDAGRTLRPETELKSVYVKTTRTKTKAAYSQITEALLGNDSFPISVEPTPIPEGIAELVHLDTSKEQGIPVMDPQAPDNFNVGFEGDGTDLKPGETQESMAATRMGNAYPDALNKPEMFTEGPDVIGSGVLLTPAKKAARMMQKMIQDQLEETKAKNSFRNALYESCMLGTGVIKGPFNKTVNINKYEGGEHSIETKTIPHLEFVSLWDLYIDPNAFVNEDIDWVIQRHRLNLHQLRSLVDIPGFDQERVEAAARRGGNYRTMSYETSLRENTSYENDSQLYEVLEYWGNIDANTGRNIYNLEIPEGIEGSVQVNVWICGDQVMRTIVNPFTPSRIPYFIFPYEKDPYSIYGTGIPELMEDLQLLMNGMVRLAVENAMLAGNVLLDVDTSALKASEDMSVHPGKIFERQAGAQGTAVNAINIPFVAHNNMQMFSQFRQMSDEATGIQSILHGQTGVSGTGRTASGLSLLLDSASMAIKNVIRNIDDLLLKPLGQAYFQWNMQFNSEQFPEIVGDLQIKAMGSHNLISKERRAAKLQTFLQLGTNPQIAPFIRMPTLIKDLAVQMEINPDEILNSPEESLAYAQLQALMNPQPSQGQGEEVPIDSGVPAGPEDPAFTGNTEGAGNVEGVQGEAPPPV